jgi:hypothetical protein
MYGEVCTIVHGAEKIYDEPKQKMVFHEVVGALPHKQRVMRMYRYGLRVSVCMGTNREGGNL